MNTSFEIPRMPFYVGASARPRNPDGFPDAFPFRLVIDERRGCLHQQGSTELSQLLARAYTIGSTVGNAMDDSEFGRKYCEDFLSFVGRHVSRGHTVLEIGAGRGYLAKRMQELGIAVTALEPGDNNQIYWDKYQVDVIKDAFPSPSAKGPFNAIVSYGVLEHIEDVVDFLARVSDHLDSAGIAIFSVPDCTEDIIQGDPGMLLHEHFQYFTESSLRRTLQQSGFRLRSIQPAAYGRALYATASPEAGVKVDPLLKSELQLLQAYGERCEKFREVVAIRLGEFVNSGRTLGLFCPGRALNVLPLDINARFFDDASNLHGMYYPPFRNSVESRQTLIAHPPNELWIMSKTFGMHIAQSLAQFLPDTRLTLVDELLRH